jgi:crotonobetainyl-CoA:carnitine CoA-transferase CaiB-like acyl-CoA transferase
MLEGLRVLDLSRVIAGPYCGALLGDLGAEVIKVERPPAGDDLRAMQGVGGMNPAFAAVNRGKRGVALDLQQPDGARIAFELAKRADVVLENFIPGTTARFGLDYERVRAANPGVVYLSLSGFGQSGPYARRPAYNVIAQGLSGIMAVTGAPGDPPTRVGGTAADVVTAYLAFGAINAALVHRFRTGQGQYLDVSLLSATLGLLPDMVALYFASGQPPGREGNRNPNIAPADVFRTSDGYLALVAMNARQWERACQVLGDDLLRTAPRFASNRDRLAHREELVERIGRALAGAPTAEWVARFEAAGVPCGPVYEFDRLFDDPQIQAAGLVSELDQPELGPVRLLNTPFRSSVWPVPRYQPAPRLGEHTAEVLAELGLERAEIERLAASGAIGLAG